jgi:hypothetical protein
MRKQYFGYNVSDEWMYSYLNSHLGAEISTEEVMEHHIAEATVLCLSRETKVDNLEFHTAALDATTNGVAIWENPDRIPIITVCSDRDESYENRPSQRQINHLTKILGTMPRWWRNSGYKNEFD